MKLVYSLKHSGCKSIKQLVHKTIADNAEIPEGFTSDFRECMEGFEKKVQDGLQENKEAEKEVEGEKETACEDRPKKRGRPKKTEG